MIDTSQAATVSVGLLNAEQWRKVTGHPIPHKAPDPAALNRDKLDPIWFSYNGGKDIGAKESNMGNAASIGEIMQELGLSQDQSIRIRAKDITKIPGPGDQREGQFQGPGNHVYRGAPVNRGTGSPD